MKTLQEIFDQAATHLLTQRQQARDSAHGACAYRTEAGLKCAVGCLIEDKYYRQAIEGVSVGSVTAPTHSGGSLLGAMLRKSGVDVEDAAVVNLLVDLQRIHDAGLAVAWSKHLAQTAQSFGLEFSATTEGTAA